MSKNICRLLISLAICSAISCSPNTKSNDYDTTIAPALSPSALNASPSESSSKGSAASETSGNEDIAPVYALDEPVDDKAIEYAENLTKSLNNSEWIPAITSDTTEDIQVRFHSADKEKSLVAPDHTMFVNIIAVGKDKNSNAEYKENVWLELKKSGTEYKFEKMIHKESADDIMGQLSDNSSTEYSVFAWDEKEKVLYFVEDTTAPIVPIKASTEGKASAQETAKADSTSN
ncbi:MAG: hypothetical protein K6G50_02930 [bacterium]|nr:hypothetical protein [bacterium]